jgi:hypothetical protein
MANANESDQAQSHEFDGQSKVERLENAVRRLQDECAKLRESLAKAEAERNLYLKALYANARATLEFKDVDIPDLEKISAGPVEMLE